MWLPIETAPKDGTSILIVNNRVRPAMMAVVYWDEDARHVDWRWAVDDADVGYHRDYPTHWMPLPDPPK
jgi:hypothetical protein